jgi:AcrR family transcriptional regulator
MAHPPSRKSDTGHDTTSPPLSRRERKKREVRRNIFQAAFELFREQGFDETTIEEIAERADVGKGTVFNYFPRKTSLLAALADDWMSLLAEEMGPVETWRGTTRQKLERVFRFLTDLSVENPDLARLALFESLRHMQSPTSIRDERGIREFLAMTRSVLHQGQQRGEVRENLETEYAANMIESAFHRTLMQWLREQGSAEDLHAEISAKLDIIFQGVAPREAAADRSRARRRRKAPRGTTK